MRHLGTVVGLGLAALSLLFLTCWPVSNARALSDAEGWSGPGWYITGSAPPRSQSAAAPNYILFEGPYILPGDCIRTYDKLYSPIGACRYLSAKPG